MIVAVASGKGGTGKTTVAVGLALVAGRETSFLDCDVEEPNARFLLRPTIESRVGVTVMVPEVDETRCTGCGRCGEICRFNAIVSLGSVPIVFPELCHGCRGCLLVCEQSALLEKERPIGTLESGRAGAVRYTAGHLRIGETMATPLIREVRRRSAPAPLTIIDAPPGTSCPLIRAVSGADRLLLVTEPTPFGLHDLRLIVGVAREIGLAPAVVVNRADIGDGGVRAYARREGIPVLAEIPEDRRIAEAYSRGEPLVRALPEYRPVFEGILAGLREEAAA